MTNYKDALSELNTIIKAKAPKHALVKKAYLRLMNNLKELLK